MSLGFTFTIDIDKDGAVTTPGVDFSGRVRLVHRRGWHAVLRVPGGSHWGGIGMRSSHASRWLLVKITRERWTAAKSPTGRPFTRDVAIIIEEESPGAKWRATRDRLVKFCELAQCSCGGFIQDGAFVHAEGCKDK